MRNGEVGEVFLVTIVFTPEVMQRELTLKSSQCFRACKTRGGGRERREVAGVSGVKDAIKVPCHHKRTTIRREERVKGLKKRGALLSESGGIDVHQSGVSAADLQVEAEGPVAMRGVLLWRGERGARAHIDDGEEPTRVSSAWGGKSKGSGPKGKEFRHVI